MEKNTMDYDAILDKLMDLAVKREEHFQLLEKDFAVMRDMLARSEERIAKTNDMVDKLVETVGMTISEKKEMTQRYDKEKADIISSFKADLKEAGHRADVVQEQNNELIRHMNWLDGQIAKLEDNLLLVRSNGIQTATPVANVTVGDFKGISKSRHKGGGK